MAVILEEMHVVDGNNLLILMQPRWRDGS